MPARPQLGVSFCKNKLKTSQTWLILAVSAAESSQDVYGRPPRSKGYIKMINTMNTRNNIPNIWSHDLLHKVIHDLLHNGMAGWVWRGWIVWAGWCVWAGRSRKTCLYRQEVRCVLFSSPQHCFSTASKSIACVLKCGIIPDHMVGKVHVSYIASYLQSDSEQHNCITTFRWHVGFKTLLHHCIPYRRRFQLQSTFSMTCKLNSITRRRLELQYRLRLNSTADHVM